MNVLLLDDRDFRDGDERAVVQGRRLKHLLEVHRARPGDRLRVGRLGGRLGEGRVLHLDGERAELAVRLDRDPPSPLPLRLVLALPRPRVLRRVVAAVASLGVEELVLVNAWRVEKSFWQSEGLRPERLAEHWCLGLEQAGDTRLPRIATRRLFRPFVEEELAARDPGVLGLCAHPRAADPCPRAEGRSVVLVVGPEGGFIEAELESLARAGVAPVHLGGAIGARVLGVEVAVAALVTRLF